MVDSTQVHKLLKKFQHPQLQDTVKYLEVINYLVDIKYSEDANHLTATILKMT